MNAQTQTNFELPVADIIFVGPSFERNKGLAQSLGLQDQIRVIQNWDPHHSQLQKQPQQPSRLHLGLLPRC